MRALKGISQFLVNKSLGVLISPKFGEWLPVWGVGIGGVRRALQFIQAVYT